ncbi:AraC family transcriptional regulator [Olivibacter sp. CPCC 100613]|uniref:helix-turn-helix transcriptional regulator n=1 Tax=Olivibacter sp. CPCC 100613 TaxID=3079931 RepID=UPI002FF6540D
MYTLYDHEFTQLVDRQFADAVNDQCKAIAYDNQFKATTRTFHSAQFNILQFDSSFQEDVRVVNFRDFNHVSLHFQLRGYSDAHISCFKQALPMKRGEFNIMNCVDPISNFSFPKQSVYSYVCIGINQQYLASLLTTFGNNWQNSTEKLIRNQPFSLFDKAKHFGPVLHQTLQLIIDPPIIDILKPVYIHHKIEELILLSFSESLITSKQGHLPFNQRDIDLLYDLKAFLDNNFLMEHTLAKLARQAGINEFKLKKGFKKLFKYTVFGYINHLRMEYSQSLLREGVLSLGTIAALIGYQSDASFIRAFKNYYGFLPKKKN